MRVQIIGAAGMLGSRLAARVAAAGTVQGRPVTAMQLVDRITPRPVAAAFPVEAAAADIADPSIAAALADERPDVVFHLAAVVSGEAEADFDKGYRINVDATRALLDGIRRTGAVPRFVFASSLAVYGPPFPDVVPDDFRLAPQSSYGVQKAIGELLVTDHSRKGFIDGIAVRLPTVVIRPGAPNAAASGFLSGILREPLAGRDSLLPVPPETAVWIASPRVAVDTLFHAGDLPPDAIGAERAVCGRGIRVTVREMIEALGAVAGPAAVARIHHGEDPAVARIVRSWPAAFAATRAAELGFPVDRSIRAIIEDHIRTDADGPPPA